ncbi:succinate dehydrogenase, cytochrome b556 subunit [Parvularcula maris]|uniref:Succinate dehydrogenase cytochrome b556 subunit n=1 Tax=Parvularcula maris TaxID=2965077 RepID=A0A9X2L6F9_9PROT|nr:succinate dehydrogenase, cytochrome b556 subunit [Parvularcula maris]MCQ8183925.1 succinate dehydrogenase, cytochrome b556 subunit [Parvularcula maris]
MSDTAARAPEDAVRQVSFIPGQNAPMSPHLQVWKFTVTMAASITQRITGGANAAGMALLVLWVASAAISESFYDAVTGFLGSWFGLVILAGFTLSVMFHMLNGLRYLGFDAGKGISRAASSNSGWAVFLLAPVLTAIIFFAGFTLGGAN